MHFFHYRHFKATQANTLRTLHKVVFNIGKTDEICIKAQKPLNAESTASIFEIEWLDRCSCNMLDCIIVLKAFETLEAVVGSQPSCNVFPLSDYQANFNKSLMSPSILHRLNPSQQQSLKMVTQRWQMRSPRPVKRLMLLLM